MGISVMEILGKRVGLAIGLFILGLIFIPSPGEASPMPNPGNNLGDMRSALKFLQDMDSYYGQIARPSLNKRYLRRSIRSSEECPEDEECEPGLARFMLLQTSDDSVSRLSRPRFGKRSDAGVPTDPRFMLLQGSDDSVSRLSRPRFGKRSDADAGVPTDSRFMLLQGSDDSISRLSRPRFGKRSEGGLMTIPNPPDLYIYGGHSFYLPRYSTLA